MRISLSHKRIYIPQENDMSQPTSSPIHPMLSNAGFTLLEIIAVMVIMAILAVVAVPRYFDLQDQARDRAMATAMAEAKGRINSYFAQQLLNDVLPSDIQYTTTTVGGTDDPNMGDFHMTITSGPTDDPILITVEGRASAVSGETFPGTMPRPGYSGG